MTSPIFVGSLQALDELREKYEDLQRNVEYIKAHLKLSTADMCPADGATSGRMQYPSTRPTSARIWVFGGHDGSDWMSDSRIFHIQKCVQSSLCGPCCSRPITFLVLMFLFLPALATLSEHLYRRLGTTIPVMPFADRSGGRLLSSAPL